MIIVLVGYMASGKSTIGKLLSERLQYNFIDLDSYIEENEGLSIPNIFSEKGEIYFRKIESNYLKDILDNDRKIVLSLGGGTPCYGKNLNLILKSNNVVSFYLKATINEIIERLKNEKENRPLVSHLTNETDLIEFVGKHLFERSHFYNQSNFTIQIENKSVVQILEEIILKLF